MIEIRPSDAFGRPLLLFYIRRNVLWEKKYFAREHLLKGHLPNRPPFNFAPFSNAGMIQPSRPLAPRKLPIRIN